MFITAKELAKGCGVGVDRISTWRKVDGLPFRKVPGTKARWMFPLYETVEWLREHKAQKGYADRLLSGMTKGEVKVTLVPEKGVGAEAFAFQALILLCGKGAIMEMLQAKIVEWFDNLPDMDTMEEVRAHCLSFIPLPEAWEHIWSGLEEEGWT